MQLYDLESVKNATDKYIVGHFTKLEEKAKRQSVRYELLVQSIASLAKKGGKRLRPYLFVLAYQSFGGEIPLEELVPVATSTELLHLALLVHDDIIDRDFTRYGIKNVSGQYIDIYRQSTELSDDDKLHFANSAAILAGDLLIFECQKAITDSGFSGEQKMSLLKRIYEGSFSVIGGELIDVEAPFIDEEIKPSDIMIQKTSSYTFNMPMLMAAELAGVESDDFNSISELGNNLGIAFQLQDDILGVFGDEKITGKPVGNDLREKKRTLLLDKCLELVNEDLGAELGEVLAKETLSTDDIIFISDVIRESGALAYVQNEVNDYFLRAEKIIDKLSRKYKNAKNLRIVIKLLDKRQK